MKRDTLLEFPCPFPIKALGYSSEAFEPQFVEIIRQYAPDLNDAAVTRRPSRNGKYTALTVTIQATSQPQIDAIYQDLSHCSHVLMAL